MNLTKETAKRLYDESPDWFRKELEKEFSKQSFDKKDWEKLKTFDDCCIACGTTEEEFNKKFLAFGLDPDTLCFEKLKIVHKAINGPDWKIDHADKDQKKWFPVFQVSSSGFGFSGSFYSDDFTNADVGSRLCFETEEKSNYSAIQFKDLWEVFITKTTW